MLHMRSKKDCFMSLSGQFLLKVEGFTVCNFLMPTPLFGFVTAQISLIKHFAARSNDFNEFSKSSIPLQILLPVLYKQT